MGGKLIEIALNNKFFLLNVKLHQRGLTPPSIPLPPALLLGFTLSCFPINIPPTISDSLLCTGKKTKALCVGEVQGLWGVVN